MTFRRHLLATTAIAGFAAFLVAPAQAGLINPNSDFTPTFLYDAGLGAGQVTYTSTFGTTAASPPFSLAAPYTLPSVISGQVPVPFIVNAGVAIGASDTTITIANASTTQAPFCFSNTSNVGAACADAYDKFDFTFTNENIATATIDAAASSSWGLWSNVEPVVISPNEFTIDVTGDNPTAGSSTAFGGQLVIDLTFGTPPPPPPPPPPTGVPEPASMAVLGVAAAGMFAARRRRPRG